MQFSNTTTLDGLIQECERITLLGTGGISGDTNQLKNFTARINQALDRFFTVALTYDSTWQFDDTNYTDLPIGTGNLVSGQQDYSFASDVLTVEKVMIKDSSGSWHDLDRTDYGNSDSGDLWRLTTGNSGTPTRYDKFANSILLDPIPNYSSTGGLKVIFKRNASKFVSGDTTKEPGIPSIFHPYLARVASLPFLLENNMDSAGSVNNLIMADEERIKQFLGRRNRDDVRRMKPFITNTR
jgi:hypothetical protein